MRMLHGRGNATASFAARQGGRGWVPLVSVVGLGWPGSGRYAFWGCLIRVGIRSTWLIYFSRALWIDYGEFNLGGASFFFFFWGGVISFVSLVVKEKFGKTLKSIKIL